MGNVSLAWILAMKALALSSLEIKLIALPRSNGAVILGAADLEEGVMAVVMGVEVDDGGVVQTCFLSCKWWVDVVVFGVVLGQHPTLNFSDCCCGKAGSARAGENLFDPHFCP
jgi:hypothetical protein